MKEIKAMEAFGTPYMTQAEELPIEERRYCTRALGKNVSLTDYRGATAEEKAEWQAEMDKLRPIVKKEI